jgi:hypothetical protein
LVTAFAAFSPTALAKTVTLQHDTLVNDTDATAVCGFVTGERFAASFTPPAYPARLLKARILLTNFALSVHPPCTETGVANDVSMPLEVFHLTSLPPGASLGVFDSFAFSNDNVLNEIDVGASNMTIDDGSFLVAYTIDQTNASPVHDNSNAADNGANFIFADLGSGPTWFSFSQLATYGLNPKGDWVIRIDVDVPDDPADGGAGGSAGAGGTGGTGASAGSGGTEMGGYAGTTGGSAGAGGTDGGLAGTGGTTPDDCSKNTDCEGGQVCDTNTSRCVQVSCTIDSECDGGYVCRDTACRKVCTTLSDCRGGETCESSGGVDVCLPAAKPASAGGGDDGGCAVAGSAAGAWGLLTALGLLAASLVRRRRAR